MASPFRFFRKYTGLMMVFLCALLMLAFVVADPLLQYSRSASGSDSGARETAVSWDGGKFTEGQLANLVQRREALAIFLQQVEGMGYRTALLEGNVDPQPIVARIQLPYTYEQGVEQSVVVTKIYADAARAAGMVISDQTINDYLTDLGLRKVSKEQMREMLKGFRLGRQDPISFVFDLLQDEMLARNYQRSYFYNNSTIMPQQKWRDWLRVNDRVIVEAAALDAADFVSEVPEPTDAELAAFFEEHRDRTPSPELVENVELPSALPAFSAPRRVVIEYAKLDLQSEADRLRDSITEEQIAQYYEQNKEQFVRADEPLIGGGLSAEGLEDAEEAGSEDAELDSEGLEEAEMEESAEQDAEAEEPTADEDAGEAEETAEEPAAEDASVPAATDSSKTVRRGPFRLAAYQPEAEESDSGDADEAESTDTSASEPLDPSELLFGPEEPSDEGDEESAEKAADEEMTGGEDDASAGDEALEEPVEYQTLEEASDEIRQILAEFKAQQEMADRMTVLVSPMMEAYDDYLFSSPDEEEEEGDESGESDDADVPQELKNLKGLAEDQGLEFGRTDELSLLELRDSAIGRTQLMDRVIPRSGQPMPLWGALLDDRGVDNFKPTLTYDLALDQNRNPVTINGYIVIKVVDKPQLTPKLDEIRPDVVKAWKLQKASELALARAEELAEQAEGEGLSLRDFLAGEAGVEVDETDPFSWLTPGQISPTAQRIPLRLSEAAPIVSAGPALMKTVFDLQPNEFGAVLNHDHSIAYVLRVVQHMRSRAELRNDFLAEGQVLYRFYGFGQVYQRIAGAAVVRDLLGESDLDWKRPPDQAL